MAKGSETLMTFQEFEAACAQEGYPLYRSFTGEARESAIEYFYHQFTLAVLPQNLYPEMTFSTPDYSNVARLPKKKWHSLYADFLGQLTNH